jgi:hypothetical protein
VPLTNAQNSFVSALHPGVAHFHADGTGITSPPFGIVGGGATFPFVAFGGGTFPPGTTEPWTNFGIHQLDLPAAAGGPALRPFTLEETPTVAAAVPEPSTLLVLGTGLLVAGWYERRRARRERAGPAA